MEGKPSFYCHRLTDVAKKSALELRERICEDDYVPEFLLHAKFHDSLMDPGYISKKWTTLSCLDAIPAGKVMEKLGQHAQIVSDVCKVAFGSAVQQPEQPATSDSVTQNPPQSVRDKGPSGPPRDSDPASPLSRQSPRQPQQSPQ